MVRARRILPPVAALAVLSIALGACSQGGPSPAEDDGDCVGRIVFRGVLYSPTRDVDRRAEPAGRLGGAQVVGCDREPIGETVPVRALAGVAPAVAVRVVGRPWRGTYVADGTPRSSWPTAPTTPEPG